MKTLQITFVLFLLVSFNTLLAATVEFKAYNSQPYMVNINGQSFAMNQGSLSLTNLLAGNYFVEITALFPPNYIGNNYMPVVFAGNINIQANTMSHYLVVPNNLILTHLSSIPVSLPNCPPQVHNPNTNFPPPYYGGFPSYPPAPPYTPSAMENNSFNQLLRSIDNQSFSNGKMRVFKQALSANYFNTNQVIQLVNAFTFRNEKVEVAKAAYTSTIDNQNYFMINDAFDYSSQIRELDRYINSL